MDRKVVIIGAGIAGMSCAIYLKRAGINVLIIEKDSPGGQLNKANIIKNYPGFSSVKGSELAFNIYSQVNELGVDCLYDEVIDIKKDKDNFIVKTTLNKINTKYVVIATGRTARKLKLENEDSLIGNGVSYCALCDGTLYKDKDVLVVGGGNSAISDAIYLASICNQVYVVHRSNTLRAENSLIKKLEEFDNVKILYNRKVIEYKINNNKIESVKLDDDSVIRTDGVFIAIGYEPISSMLMLDNDNNYIIVDNKMNTSIDNVYAIGDAIKKDVYQLVTAANDGVIAAVDIIGKLGKKV